MLQGGGKDEMKQKKCFFFGRLTSCLPCYIVKLKKIEPLGLFAGILLLSTLVESMHTMRIIIVSC